MAERTKMPREERAKQFNPFDALKGLKDALHMKEYEHERREKEGVDEEALATMAGVLLSIERQDEVRVVFYKNGHYHTLQGKCKPDFIEKSISFQDEKILFDDIKEITIIEK